jgi:hypothetical protein
MKLTANYQGQKFSRNTKANYTHVAVALSPSGEIVDFQWSKSEANARKAVNGTWIKGGWTLVAVIAVDGTEAPATPKGKGRSLKTFALNPATGEKAWGRIFENGVIEF